MLRLLGDSVEHGRSMKFVERQLEAFGIADVAHDSPDELNAARTQVRKVLRRVLTSSNDNNPTR